MFEGSCHCGAITFSVSQAPKQLVDCNCTICRRVAALWAHSAISDVQVDGPEDGTITYVQGAKSIAIHSCRTCGCTTHWENIQPDGEVMALNFRMCSPEDIAHFKVRKFDGADTWAFLD